MTCVCAQDLLLMQIDSGGQVTRKTNSKNNEMVRTNVANADYAEVSETRKELRGNIRKETKKIKIYVQG